jgi:NADH-quinone oxidoreductase subunit H
MAGWPIALANLFYLAVFVVKVVFFFFLVSIVKAIVPRYRYDQLMRLGWKVFLPTSLVAVVLIAAWRVFAPHYLGVA